MQIGTKSVLFGAHQFILHPLYVVAAWLKIYGRPNIRELVCIVIHDWGYIGCPNIDGAKGVKHPEFGGKIAGALFGNKYRDMVLYHSHTYANMYNKKESYLCWADKYSFVFEYSKCYLWRTKLTDELEEYMQNWKVFSGEENITDIQWFLTMRYRILRRVEISTGIKLVD